MRYGVFPPAPIRVVGSSWPPKPSPREVRQARSERREGGPTICPASGTHTGRDHQTPDRAQERRFPQVSFGRPLTRENPPRYTRRATHDKTADAGSRQIRKPEEFGTDYVNVSRIACTIVDNRRNKRAIGLPRHTCTGCSRALVKFRTRKGTTGRKFTRRASEVCQHSKHVAGVSTFLVAECLHERDKGSSTGGMFPLYSKKSNRFRAS